MVQGNTSAFWLEGASWVGVILLAQELSNSVTFAESILAFSTVYAVIQISLAGWHDELIGREPIGSPALHFALTSVLLRCLAMIFSLGSLIVLITGDIWERTPLLYLLIASCCFVGSAMSLYLIVALDRLNRLYRLIWPLSTATALLVLAQINELSAVTLIASCLMVQLVLLFLLVCLSKVATSGTSVSSPEKITETTVLTVLFNVDLLVLPVFLSLDQVPGYLLGRAVLVLCRSAINTLERRAASNLLISLQSHGPSSLRPLAARLNLGVMLAGGGVYLLVLTAAGLLPRFFDTATLFSVEIMMWMALAQAGPILFGSTELILRVLNFRKALLGLGLISILFAVLAFSTIQPAEAVTAARIYAVSQLVFCGLSAIELARRSGILPGITALLFRQIKIL